MLNKIFAVYDSKTQLFDEMNTCVTRDEAIRFFGKACNTPNMKFNEFAEDYSLYEIGILNNETGIITAHAVPLLIVTAISCSNKHREYYASLAVDKLEAVS